MLFNNLTLLLLAQTAVLGFTYKSYQTKIECTSKSTMQYPKDLTELQKLINDAIKSNTRVKIVGARHSITDTICTDGIPINLKHFNSVVVNKETNTATIGTGIELIDAMDILHEQGYTINHIPAYGGITVGGAIGLAAHGSSLKHANSLSEYLVGLTVIDGKGQLKKVGLDDPHFDSFRVNFGLLGAIVEVTLQIEPRFKMSVNNYRVQDTKLTSNPNAMIDLARQNDWFQFWWFPSNGGLVISEGKYLNANSTVSGDARTNLISNVSPFVAAGSKLAFELIQATNNGIAMEAIQKLTENSLYKLDISSLLKRPVFTEGTTGKFVNPAVGYNYRLMANRCNPCPWDSPLEAQLKNNHLLADLQANNQTDNNTNDIPSADVLEWLAVVPDESSVALDIKKLPEVVADISKLIKQYPTAFPLIGLFFRFSPASRGNMALSSGRDTFSIDWTYPMRIDPYNTSSYGLHTMQALIQTLIFKHGGRPHWGKNGLTFFKKEILQQAYPQQNLLKFKAAVQQYDPNGLFSNKFGNRILNLGENTYDVPEKVSKCALQDYCLCTKDSDCSLLRKCGSIWNYPVCQLLLG